MEVIARADGVIHAGDFVTERALTEIESIGPPLSAVHGNVDEAALRQRLPEVLRGALQPHPALARLAGAAIQAGG